MAWNDSGNGKDPWKKDGQESNDLDQIVQNWQRRISDLISGGRGSGPSSAGIYVLIILLLGAWGLTGFYRVDQAERGVVQHFGAYKQTTLPGLQWHMPFPIETVDIVNIEAVDDFQYRTEMLTADEQYLFIDMVVQYRISDAVKYSFEVEDPEITLQDVTESALRGVVGTSSLEQMIGERRAEIPARTIEELQKTLDGYGAGTGLTVLSINLTQVYYPEAVKDAVDDTQKAGQDRDRYILEAQTYVNDIIPKSRGEAQRVLQDAEAYRERVIANATGDASRFEALLTQYQMAPQVTRDRLYLEAIEEVYRNSNKVLVDSDGSGNMLYLPLDKIMQRSTTGDRSDDQLNQTPGTQNSDIDENDPSRDTNRDRRTRQ